MSLGKEDYLAALNTMASGGWIGTKIYDVLLLRCAARCAVERIYTFNLGDFSSWLCPVYKRKYAHHDPARNPSPVNPVTCRRRLHRGCVAARAAGAVT